jgi:hypothetical protein
LVKPILRPWDLEKVFGFKPSAVQVKLQPAYSANELDLGMPTTCQVRSEVVLSGEKKPSSPPPRKKTNKKIELSGSSQLINMGCNIHPGVPFLPLV